MMIKGLFIGIVCCLSGCAVSPQAIQLNPSVTVTKSDLGQGRKLNLRVVDQRQNKALGSRGGIYSETALLQIQGGPVEPIRQELFGALNAYDFSVTTDDQGTKPSIDLLIEIEEFKQRTLEERYPKLVKNHILLQAVCVNKGLQFTGRYAASLEEDLLTTPTAKQNQRMIDSLVSKALIALLEDPKLLQFLE